MTHIHAGGRELPEVNMGAQNTSNGSHRGKPLRDPEAAEFLGVSKGTLPQWRARGQGPRYVKVGRAVRYFEGDLAAFLDARTIEPAGAGR